MVKKNKYTNKEIVEELQSLNYKLGKTKITYKNNYGSYIVALSFLSGVSIFAYGLGRYNEWDILISVGVSLIALAFFVMWIVSQGDI